MLPADAVDLLQPVEWSDDTCSPHFHTQTDSCCSEASATHVFQGDDVMVMTADHHLPADTVIARSCVELCV